MKKVFKGFRGNLSEEIREWIDEQGKDYDSLEIIVEVLEDN